MSEDDQLKRGSLFRNILLLLTTIVAMLILAEIAVRLAWHNPYRGESPDRIVRLRIHHAAADYIIDREAISPGLEPVRFRTDSRGYIVPSKRFRQPDHRIVFFGGSTTECIAVREEMRFPARVSYLLEENGFRVNTLNLGRSGNTLHDALNLLLDHALLDSPDVAVLMHATNDAGVLKDDPVYRSRMGRLMTASDLFRYLLQKGSNGSALLGMLRSAVTSGGGPEGPEKGWIKPRFNELPVDQYRDRLEAFVGICRAFGITPVLMTQPLATYRTGLTPQWASTDNQSLFNRIIRQVAEEKNAVLIDLDSYVRTEVRGWNEPMKLFYDGMHVTDQGSEIYARYSSEVLLERVHGKTETGISSTAVDTAR